MGLVEVRTLIVGDIHGCYQEFLHLMKIANIDIHVDKVISVGDIIDRGPESDKVLKFFMVNSFNAHMVLGNHDDKYFRYLKGNKVKVDKDDLGRTIEQVARNTTLRNEDIKRFLTYVPLKIETDSFIVVHGAYRDAAGESEAKSLNLRGEASNEKDSEGYNIRLDNWKHEYKGTKDIIVGHSICKAPDVFKATNAEIINLDGGCCFGGELVGITYPDKKFYKVKANKVYCERKAR